MAGAYRIRTVWLVSIPGAFSMGRLGRANKFLDPMTDAEMEEKFRSMAQKHLSADRLDNLLRLLWALETQPQVGTLIAATRHLIATCLPGFQLTGHQFCVG